ncbi:hypothetical protein [Metasolibacillus meyeri]|uniref:hypothetical protein n=1 Tax=Metasolibacillus meyeri TaxID=1071052 RepID=UPI000D318CC2|nr:hypothetical protein [Metasolibacillus meyeri]
MTARISMLETIDGKQFKTRYHMHDRLFISLKEDVIIAVKQNHPSMFVFVKNQDGVFDCISDIQIDKETPTTAEIWIHTKDIINTNISDAKDVTVQLDIEKSKRLKEKTFFDF